MSQLKATEQPIVVTRRFNTSKEVLWTVLTSKEHMTKWFFENIPSFQAIEGYKVSFLIKNENRNFTHRWKVKKVVDFKKLKIKWTFKEYPGESYSVFKLKDDADGCLLTLKATVCKEFPDGIPEFTRESGVAGWDYFINQRLQAYLDSL
jgi:uncharacterized protein YndB with AHSA1/START domain